MKRGRGHLTDWELEQIQDNSRRAWNALVARDEAEERKRLPEDPQARPDLRVVPDADDN